MAPAPDPSAVKEMSALYNRVYARNSDNGLNAPQADFATRLKPDSRLLDIGGGVDSPAAFARLGHTVTSYELARSAVRLTNAVAAAEGLRLTCELRDVRDGIDGVFDAVVLSNVLQHLPATDASRLLAGLHQHVAPGGLTFILAHSHDGYFAHDARAKGQDGYYPADGTAIMADLGPGWRVRTCVTEVANFDTKGSRGSTPLIHLVASRR